ncbi:MAG: hypothetical protein ACLGH4_10215, partial [Actinomycetes bacterium]
MTYAAHHPATPSDPAVRGELPDGEAGVPDPPPGRRGLVAAVWSGLTAVVGTVMGLVPHVLHHVSFFAGAALVTGVGGNLAFGALGLLFSVP